MVVGTSVQWRPVTFNPGSRFVLGDFGMDFCTVWFYVIDFRSGLTKEFEGGDVTLWFLLI